MHASAAERGDALRAAAVSEWAFAGYLVLVGIPLVFSPNTLLALFGFPHTDEVWVRVLGVVVVSVAVFHAQAARRRSRDLMVAGVIARAVFALGILPFALLGLAQPVIVLFALTDAGAAMWTALALRERTGGAEGAPATAGS